VIALAKVRAGFRCEIPGCTSSTFIGEYGHPYCEVHHIEWLSEGGADTPENVASLCPMHHREIHFGKGRQKLTDDLLRLRANEHTPILQIIK
jgi:predicted HNH restriction endonuclease